MTVKTKLIFGDVFLLLVSVFPALVVLMKWPLTIILFFVVPLLILKELIQRNFNVRYPYGKVSIFFMFLMVVLFIFAGVTALLYRVNCYDYNVWPSWHRLLGVSIFLAGALSMAFRIFQDRKFSETKECK
ncbi:MAG: hypothetical protein PHQ35_01960 [Phycisphaerae bacterium]|nr:hypothetical protein [Phycisphaerae bacterium]MDD5380409.1 hypothetical protein [Phycisphaerae bacterium]